MLWNCAGLQRHFDELTQFLRDRRVDIGLLTETHLKENSHCYVPGFTLYKCTHPDGTAKSGSVLLIRQGIKHFPKQNYQKTYIQSVSVEVATTGEPITFSSVYSPPNSTISSIQYTHFFQSLGRNFIAGGDYNSKHQQFGCRVTTPRGNALYNSITFNNYYCYSPNEPTYYPTDLRRQPDILDMFISSKFLPYYSIDVVPDLSSDHSPIILTIDSRPLLMNLRASLTMGMVNWNQFRDILMNTTELNIRLKTQIDIENAVEKLTQHIQEACWESSDCNQHKSLRIKNVPIHIRELIVAKRRCRRAWQLNRYPRLKNELNRLTRHLKTVLKQHREDRFMNFSERLTTRNKSLWYTARKLLNYPTPSFGLRNHNGDWVKSDREKAEVFAKHLFDTFQPHDLVHPHHNEVVSFLDVPLQLSLPPKPISPNEVEIAIKNLPVGKAPGYDLITATILRNIPRKTILLITYIFNSIIRLSHFPIQWKFSIITLFPKPGKPHHLPSSYRPISLLPLLSKLFEKLIITRIDKYITNSIAIPHHQFGFRAAHSTIQQCHRIVNEISSALEKKQYCCAVFLDVSQAFDRVWHAGLLFKLKQILPDSLYLLMKSYLEDRNYKVKQGDDFSCIYSINAGVPQGSVLAPTLFAVSVNDMPLNDSTLMAMFADDVSLLSSDSDPIAASRKVQNHLNVIEPWLKLWKIKINEMKSQHVTFTLRRLDCPPIYINNIQLSHTSTVKYLGLHLDRRLTWNTHVTKTRQTMKTRFFQLKRLLDSRSRLTIKNKLTIYKTMIRPIWTYGVQLWGSAKPSHTKRIQAIQNKILRTITQCPFYVNNSTLHNDLHIPYIIDIARSSYKSLYNKFHTHTNPLIIELAVHVPNNHIRRLKRHWPRDLLI
jgi:hypothetical protein